MTVPTKLKLWNIVLTTLRSQQVTSTEPTTTREAKILDANWEAFLWKHFADHPWNELTTYTVLAEAHKVENIASFSSLDTPHPQFAEYYLGLSSNAQIVGLKDADNPMGQGPQYEWEEYYGIVDTGSPVEYTLFATDAPLGTSIQWVLVPLTDDQLALWKWANAQAAMLDFAFMVASQFGATDKRVEQLRAHGRDAIADRRTLDSMSQRIVMTRRESSLVTARRMGYGGNWSSR